MNLALSKINNNRGLTLLELVVALALTGMLLVFFIGANIFIQKVLMNWSQDNIVTEEREFLLEVIGDEVSACDSLSFDSSNMSLICYRIDDSTIFMLEDSNLLKNNKALNRYGVIVDKFEISQDVFTKTDGDSILKNSMHMQKSPVLYKIGITVSYKGKTDVAVRKIRNVLAYSKQ